METIDIDEARTQLSRLVDAVSRGQEFVIAIVGQPAARLVSAQPRKIARRFGTLKGQIRIAADFDAPLPAASGKQSTAK